MANKDNKSKLTYHVWDKDNNEYDIPDEVVQQRGMDNFAKDFEGGYITMFDDKKQKVDVPIEDVGEYRKQGYMWYDTSGNATPINEVGKKPSPSKEKEQSQYPQEVKRGVLKKPGIISQALGMMPKVDAGNIGREQKVGGMISNLLLGDNQQVQQPAQKEASPESKEAAPVTTPTGVVNNEGLMDAKLANYIENWKQRPDKEGDYFANIVADLLADGTANSNEEAVNMVMPALYRYANRSAMDVTNQVVSSLPDDTVQDAEQSIDAQWYSHGVQDKLKQEADSMGISYDDYVAHFLKPAMVQSLVNKYGPNYRNIAEGIATRLYAHDEHVQDRLMNQDINDALSDVIAKYTSTSVAKAIQDAEAASNAQMAKYNEQSKYVDAASPFAIGAMAEANKTRDPQKILSGLQQKFGKLYRNPDFLNDMSNAAFKVMQRYGLNGTLSGNPKQFKPMINAAIKNELDQLEVKGMIPRGSADYILKTGIENTIIGKVSRKIMQTDYQNWLEDIANQQYHPGFWENVASGALTFAGDAWSYWLPGAAGGKLTKSMVAKAEGKLAGDLMAKGMERKMAERAAKVLIGKSKAEALKSGAVHGAVTFGGQSAISKPIDEVYRTGQFDENGKIYNPSVGKVIANTLGEVAKQSAVGAIMQGGTIANMVGKGRGLATNILADVGGKVVDSGIMTGHQMLERMAQDPNFKPTGKDAAESFLESMANLTAIGLPGMVGKYARFKDAREFNKKFDFTDQDIAELKRFGYDGLRDAFEKVGIGEYAVVGENAQRLDGQLTQKYIDLMNDKSVPEVLKAKMMAVVEGKRPSSFSPIVDSIIIQPMDNGGKVYLETLNKDGGIVERKEFSSLDEAQKADKKLEYEKTLGLASVLEGEFHKEFTQELLEGLYNKAAQKYNMGEKLTDEDKAAVYLHQNAGAIKEIMDKQQKGFLLTEEEQKQVNAYRHYYDGALENSSVMREFVNTFEDSHGVARGTLRKALESKDKKYSPLVESYLKELYNSIELKREMKQTMDDFYNTSHGNEQKRIEGENPVSPVESSSESSAGGQEPPVSEEPAPYQDRTNSVPTPSDAEFAANSANLANENQSESKASDAFVMGQNAYKNGDTEGLKSIKYNAETAELRLKRAFANDTDRIQGVYNAVNKGTDIETYIEQRTNYLTPFQQEAIRKYAEAMDANKGAMDALEHADDGYADKLKQQLSQYTMENGNISSLTLTDGQRGYWKSKNEHGAGFGVFPDANGQPVVKQVPSSQVKENGKEITLQEYVNQLATQKHEATKKNFNAIFDATSLKPNDTVSLSINDKDQPTEAKIVSVNPDGTISFNIAGSKNVTTVPVDTFNKFQKYALRNSINAELDAEDAERAEKEAIKVEAEKKQRFANGIVGLSEQKPDYSSKETDPKVAAEYLQEQYGEDHGKLLNLVNGSRDDIKTQLANKRKAAAEYQNWLDTNADLDPEKAKKVEDELSLANEQIADLDARFKNWNTIRNSVMTPDEVKAMTEERKAEVEKAGVDETAIVPSDDFHVLVLDDKELKKQYPTMDEATDYITSQRKDIYHTQEDVERKINGVNDMLDQYINGETELEPNQLMELNTTKAQLESLQTNLSVAAKGLKAQANKLSKLYKTEVSQQEMEELGMTPSEHRKVLVSDAIKKNDLGAIIKIYKDASVDVTDFTPQTLEEAVSEFLRPHSLNPESLQYELGKSNFKFGIGKGYDSNKFNYLIAKKGTGMSVNDFAVKVYNDLPVNLQDMGYTDQDVRNTLLDMFKSYDSVKEMKNVALMNRIAAAEDELSSEEEYYEAQKEREIIERQAEIEKYKSYIHEKALSLPSESELDHINGLEFDRMMEIEDREREYKQYVKSILPELADYDDRSNEEGYGGGSSLGSDSSRRGVDEGNSQGEEVGNGEASSESEIGEGSDSGRKGRQEVSSMEPGEGSAVRGSHLPQEASFGERLKSAIAETETEPTEAQKKAGNYKKGHLSFGGYDYTVETPKGVTRSGKDEQGKPWSVTMHDTYGYILGKIGVDGDHIDMFINDAADLDTFDGNVYVVDQVNPETGEFDEHKVMYGYPSEEAATEAYLANYSKGWKGLGNVTSVPKATFDKWLESSDRKTKPFADYAMVQKEQAKFDRDVKEVEPSEMTEAQKVAYDAVSTMLKKVGIPVKVVSNEDMEKVAEAQGKGVVYGYTDGKEIVLNQEHLNPNTPIHEYQHLWRTAAKNMNPELIEHGDKLIMQTQLFADLKQDPNYNHLTDEQICDEAFARLTGEDGAAILEQMAKEAIKENPLDTAKELTIINRLKIWLKKFWYWTLDTFTKWKPEDIKKMTLEDIRNLVLRDLANGVDPRNVKSRMTKEDAVSLRKQMEDNAEQERILEHTEENWQKEFGKDSRVTTPIGSIKLGENQYKKAGRNDRIKRFGLLKPTLERPDVILEKSAPKEGAERQTKYLFIKSFKKADGNKILNYESITVKQGEEEVAISAHQIDPSKVVKELTESKVLWNRFRGDSNSLGENQGSALTPSANNPSGKDSVLNPHSDAKIRNNIETAKGNGGNLSVEDKIKAVSRQFAVDEADVAMYANAIKKGSTAEAARARANIKRHLLQANEDKISSLKELLKYTKPVNESLKENFGDVDAMIEERVKQVEAQRNAMEAARKRAEEEEAKRQKHLEELSVIPDDQLDKQYMDALAKGDDATAREMLDEAARRKGYDDTESAYQGVGAWAAPGNPGYESDKARRDDWESSGSDVNLEDMALGYTPQPDDYFSHPERYSQNTPHGLESVKAINAAIDAIKNGKKDVKVKVYRAVPTSVKEGKLRNGDWVTPSKKYADIHGNNRLEGKYRIIEDEVPANQLWWDGNDANEFGFDDGKEYKYKNAKNNRKLNDLVTYDDEGDVIPPSKRFNSRKKDIRFMFAGEKGAAEADKADEQTIRMDNLDVAKQMEKAKKDAKIIKMATGWEKGVDGKWRYEMPDAKIKDTIDVGGGNIVKRFEEDMLWTDGKLEDAVDAPKLFEAYPQLKNIKIHTDAVMNDMPSNGEYNPQTKTITIHADELKYLNSILNHEIQHVIQREEGFAHGGTPEQVERDFNAAKAEWKARSYAFELEEKAKEMGGEYNQSEVEKALIQEYKDMDMPEFIPDKEARIKGFNYFARGYADRSMDDAIKRFRLNESTRSDFDSYKEYLKLAGEVESRNVEKRLGMTDEERRNSLAEETEDVNRDEQIVMNGNDASYSIVKDPETIKKLDKEDTVKVYRAMQVGEDGKLYPPMAAKVKGKFVQPIELGKWEQADERPELADDKGMFTLNKGNGKSLKAAYNPYLHTSRTPLNDQFSEAQNRPNIVTVEVEVPKSELTSGYKADKAKDAVGEVEWKAGIIQGQLTGKRKVVLSRWDKPVRIVPDSEVADVIVNDMFKGKNITMPSNVVTPSLRKELEKRGVPFVETDNRGRIVGGENDGVHYSKVYGKNHREKGYRSILKFSLGENGTDIAAGNGDSINKNPNKNVITRRIGSRAQAQARVNETLGAAAADFRRDQTAAAQNQQGTWKRGSVLGHVIRAAKANASFIPQEELKEIVGETIGHGEENYVYHAKYDNQKVIKLNDFTMTDNLFRINEFIDRINAHNEFMPEDKYTPLGFAYNHKGDPCIVMEQPYIRGTQPTNEEIFQYLMDHGFKIDMIQISADESDLGWTNGKFDLWDAEPRNVIKDKNGDLHFFDTMIQHTYIPNHKNPLRLSKSSIRTFESQEMMDSAERVKRVANVLGGAKAVTYTSSADVPEEYRIAMEQGARGWYDPTTHTVHVYLPNCADANEAERTVLHEKIGHEGMEVLLGGENEVRKFANFVYRSVGKDVRGKIIDFANKYDPDWKNPDRMNVGTQEYIAHLAEEGPKTAEDFSLWTKIKHYLIKVLKKLGVRVPGLLNDKDLRYYLMKAGKALHVWDEMPQEKQEAMMKQASNAEIKDALSDGANLPSEEDNKPKKKTERGRIDEATGAFKLAPNGEQSNLSKKQYIEARTKNFKDWFGGDWEKKPKDFKNKLDANSEPLEKYVEGYLNRPKKPTMPKKRKGEDEATFFGRKMLYSQALEDWPKTEADWKKRIDEFDENTLAALTPPDEEAIREKYQKLYENDMASWRKDHPYIKEGEERPLEIPDMRDYQSIQDYGEALRKHEIWKTAPHKDEYDRMAEDEIISKVALMDAVQHPFSEYARLKTMKAEFQHMRHVMQNQKVYDQNTTDAVVQFAKRFMSLGYGDDLGRGSINTLLTIVKNSTGKKSYEISQHLYQVMDVLMNNQLRNFDRAVMKTMSIKELKENAKGIQVQGKLELRGQTTIKAFRDAVSSRISSDKLDEKISNLIDKMATDKKNASSYQDELLGLNLAKQYVDYIDSSRNDAIEIEDMKRMEIEGYKNRKGIYEGELTKALLQEHVERLNQYDDALFNNKVERMERYSQLLANLGGMIDESVKGAREFQERDARRAIKVKMMASADLGGKSMNQHHKENWKTRLSNSDVVRLFCSPLGSFDALMREFGSKQINGEGQLWNHFVRGAMKASNDAFKSVREANNEIDLKVSELFGKVTEDKNGNKKGNMILNDLYALERSNKVKSLDVTIRDIEGEQTYKLQQGNLMYIYMVNKMPDGAMKLRQMGILDADVERIKENIDPRFLKLADWIQGEFLPKMRTKYNKRHEELFGAPMPMVENYFPLRVLKNARYMEEDVNNTSDGSNALPSTATGAIIKRKTNKLPLDILNADALSVTIDNIKEMENWYNYAPIRKDANTLLSDTAFRNRVQNMTTIYGSGERLWNNVKDATAVAMGTYRPKGGTDLAVSLKNFGKGITGAKISFRLYTAFKQVLSAPMFLPDVDLGRFVRHSVHPYGSFKWAIENLPNFDKRWSGRKLGDTVLMDDPTDWKLWHTNLMEKAAYYGMTPNALVDAVTCAVGARAVYDTKYKQYIKYGLTEERAKEKALSDAEINFNTSQQSSEGAFVSPMQLDRTLESAIFTPFRNSSMLYERKGINALRNLKHRFEKGHKEASIKFMAGQLMEEGVGYEQATKAAEKMYQKGLMHNIADAIVSLWLGAIIWNLGGNLGYLMFGDDNEKKKKMVLDAVILGLLEGPVDGLAGGQFINTAIANTITSDGINLKGLKNVDLSGMPMLSDFNSMIEKFGYDKVAGAQDLMFIVMQSATGFNPKTLTDAINACIDYGNGDMTNAKEIALFVFRLMNGPAATVDNLYIDELGMKGKDAKKLSYEELAKRYAEYKFGKNTFGLGKLYSDEEKQKKLKAIEKSFDKKVSERLAGMDREDLKNEFSESRSQKEKKLIGKIIADELETKDSEAVKKAKADASYLRQRNFSDLMDDLYLQKEWEATNEANAGLEELKGNGASEKEIEAYETKHKADLDKRKAIQKARKEMQKKKADISSDNDEATMAAIRKLRDSILKTVRQTKK